MTNPPERKPGSPYVPCPIQTCRLGAGHDGECVLSVAAPSDTKEGERFMATPDKYGWAVYDHEAKACMSFHFENGLMGEGPAKRHAGDVAKAMNAALPRNDGTPEDVAWSLSVLERHIRRADELLGGEVPKVQFNARSCLSCALGELNSLRRLMAPPGNNVGLLDVIAEMRASTLWLSNSVAGWVEKLEAIARAPEEPEQEGDAEIRERAVAEAEAKGWLRWEDVKREVVAPPDIEEGA